MTSPNDDHPYQHWLDRVKEFPAVPGVYLMLDADDREIYVGKAKSLKNRVRQYFDLNRHADPKTRDLVSQIASVKYIETESEVEAYLLECRLIKDLQPKFNTHMKSDIRYPYVEITWGEDFPRVRITRDRSNPQSTYYGPYVSAGWLRGALKILGKVFHYRTCSLDISEGDPKWRHYRPCLEHAIGRCGAPCNARQRKADYREDMKRLARALNGGIRDVRQELELRMKSASATQAYEDAARLRDQIQALESLKRRGNVRHAIEPEVLHIDPQEGLRKLGKAFSLGIVPRHIEAIDIAHLQGQGTVGSLVSFIDGLPEKNGYRRFKIKSHDAIDDFASIHEVVRRRYTRLQEEKRPLPDIILIDGGLGQLHAAHDALHAIGIPGFESSWPEPLSSTENRNITVLEQKEEDLDTRIPAPELMEFDEAPLVEDATDLVDDLPATDELPASPDEGAEPETAAAITAPVPGAPVLCSLAKREELLYSIHHRQGLKLTKRNPGLRLLMHARDEAHRFAQHYHHILRRKIVFEE